jgi:hypothetical protein
MTWWAILFSLIPAPDMLSSETFASMSLLASGRDGISLQGDDTAPM